ncbi:MAG TPA: hypothetical protein VEQ42_09515, partial [Pyrinomonadaceae bacterium]|nr:hypothetical protein [Pyrinomonadaceae bacterium]
MTRKPRGKTPKKTETTAETAGGLCFVVMPYGEPFDGYYAEVYAPAVRGVGLEPVRADSLFRSSSILEDIWRLTRDAKVLLADMSTRNPNVFYELGLAHAIARPVVLVASSIEDVPFDLRGLRVLIYNKDDAFWGKKLSDAIQKALLETLKDLRSAVPPTFMESAPPTHVPREDAITLELRKLQDTVRAMQASLPQATKESPVQAVLSRPALQRVKALDHLYSRAPIIITEGLGIISSVEKGYRKEAAEKLRNEAKLSPEEIETLLDELADILQSPKDELLRTD